MSKLQKIAFITIRGQVHEVLFSLGQICATRGALDLLDRCCTNASTLLDRHRTGDWGAISREDWCANRDAVAIGARILSAYELGAAKERVWLITEADRSATTLLLPEEY